MIKRTKEYTPHPYLQLIASGNIEGLKHYSNPLSKVMDQIHYQYDEPSFIKLCITNSIVGHQPEVFQFFIQKLKGYLRSHAEVSIKESIVSWITLAAQHNSSFIQEILHECPDLNYTNTHQLLCKSLEHKNIPLFEWAWQQKAIQTLPRLDRYLLATESMTPFFKNLSSLRSGDNALAFSALIMKQVNQLERSTDYCPLLERLIDTLPLYYNTTPAFIKILMDRSYSYEVLQSAHHKLEKLQQDYPNRYFQADPEFLQFQDTIRHLYFTSEKKILSDLMPSTPKNIKISRSRF